MDERLLKLNLQFFAKEGPGGEKTEEPTEKKLKDAREEGNVAKSQEFGSAATLMVIFLLLKFYSSFFYEKFLENFTVIYGRFSDFIKFNNGEMPLRDFAILINQIILRMLFILSPFMIIGFVMAVVINVAQVKWQPTAKPLRPKFSKLNPVSGIKRLFSTRKLFELIKSIAKLLLVGLIVYNTIKEQLGVIYLMYEYSIKAAIAVAGGIITDIGIRVSAAYVVLAFIDYAYQKHKFHEDMKMTKQEVKDEYKNAEGDPQVKSKIKAKMREVSRRRMMSSVPEADVVITNPTHFAVALKYDNKSFAAPVVVAKGEDYVAQRIKEVAKENSVDIVENKPLARMLYYNVDIGAMIPPELYQAVAEVLAYVYSLHNKTN